METLTVVIHRDPKLIVKGLERTELVDRGWLTGLPTTWRAFCRTKNLNQVKILLRDQGAKILEGRIYV
jgi:hypothetical protein